MGDYRRLHVWQRAHRLTLDVYQASRTFPKEGTYALTSQLRRASSAIPANFADGSGRNGDVEFARFLDFAKGSATELHYHLLLARDLGHLTLFHYDPLAAEAQAVAKMLASFIDQLRRPR